MNCVRTKKKCFFSLLASSLDVFIKGEEIFCFQSLHRNEQRRDLETTHRRVHLSSCQSVAFLDPSPRITDHLLRISKCASLAALRVTLRFFLPWHPDPLSSNRSQRPNLPLQLPSVSILNQGEVKRLRLLWVLGHQLAIQLCCFETPEPYQPEIANPSKIS